MTDAPPTASAAAHQQRAEIPPDAREFRFGVVATYVYSVHAWAALAQRVEAAGFDTLLVADHYANALACTPLIATAAHLVALVRAKATFEKGKLVERPDESGREQLVA